MTCLIGEVLDGPGTQSHTSMLGTFFVYTLALCMPIFKKKSPLKRLGKNCKLFIVVTLLQNFADQASHCNALLIGWLHLCSRVYQKIRKYLESGGENPVFLRQNVYYIKSLVPGSRRLPLDAAVLSRVV